MNLATHVSRLCPVVVCLAIAGCGLGGSTTVHGSGHVSTESRPVSHFNEIELAGSGDLYIRQTGAESLTIEADDNLLPLITSRVEGHRLALGVRDHINIVTAHRIVYRVTVKDLSAIVVSGSANVHATDIHTGHLSVRISGSGDVKLSGRAENQTIDISGSGSYAAGKLESTDAAINVSGSGSVVVKVNGHLDARISGSGSIEYAGNPSVTSRVTGAGSIRHRTGD